MPGFFKRIFGKSAATPESEIVEVTLQPLQSDVSLAAIGDIHGCADLTEKLLAKLAHQAPNVPLLFVGDLIDRGEQSRQVLERLMDMPEATCLLGNHERMCLDFLDDPETRGARWLRNGGLQTIASYGVSGTQSEITKLRDAFALAMGDAQINWLLERPLFAKFGNLYAIHAGADPMMPIEDQGEKPLIWGHPKFQHQPRPDGQWVVHGHTIVDQPRIAANRVSIDTGAYATGTLTAAVFSGGEVEFIQAHA